MRFRIGVNVGDVMVKDDDIFGDGVNVAARLEVRPAHDPVREYGFLGVVIDSTNLEGSIWTWWREEGKFRIEKTATIPPEPASKDQLPPLLQGFGAVPPLVTDIDLSMDDRFLYVACWGTGEMRQYDVTDPRKPKLAGSVHVGGIARRAPHPSGKVCAGGPQMVEISRDGKRVYWTNSLYSTWDNQFYPVCRYFSIVSADKSGRRFMKSGIQFSLLCRYMTVGFSGRWPTVWQNTAATTRSGARCSSFPAKQPPMQ